MDKLYFIVSSGVFLFFSLYLMYDTTSAKPEDIKYNYTGFAVYLILFLWGAMLYLK